MVLGIRSKSRKSAAVEVDYLIHVLEIKPWPLSQALKSVESVLLQWENGDQSSGSFACDVGDGRIYIGQSFPLPVTLYREKSRKSTVRESYVKNNLELYLYEPRKDKAVKGQLLASAVINLADYGIIEETRNVTPLLNWKKSFKSSVQPVLYLNIQPSGKSSSSLSPEGSLSREVSLEKDGTESVPESTNDAIASFTDDDDDDDDDGDISSHSSHTITSSAFETKISSSPSYEKNGLESTIESSKRTYREPSVQLPTSLSGTGVNPVAKASKHQNGSLSPSSSVGSSSSVWKPAKDVASLRNVPTESSVPVLKKSLTHSVQSSSSSSGNLDNYQDSGNGDFKANRVQGSLANSSAKMQENDRESILDDIVTNHAAEYLQAMQTYGDTNSTFASNADSRASAEDDHLLKVKEYSFDDKLASRFSQDATRKQVKLKSETFTLTRKNVGVQGSKVKGNELKNLKSLQLPFVRTENNTPLSNNGFIEKTKEARIREDAQVGGMASTKNDREDRITSVSDSRVELQSTIEFLREELREAAAVEVGLYSVVAEHGSSTNKIHAPARRLSRFYFHACKTRSPSKKANAARAAVTGLILVSKACGNDVARLTFWLSNSIVLRAIVNQNLGQPRISTKTDSRVSAKKGFPPQMEENKSCDHWEDQLTFMVALEKFEGWIFSRIVESVWWQNMTPHMQPAAAKGSSSRKTSGRKYGLERGNFSIDLWNKAFKDACERLCPVRAAGHECGCLPLPARLVMEQLVTRLDVAMFNAILRENAEEMPTDPVSDPISDPKVLPIPAGKSSFGAGAQLKNTIGSWSRWLTDLFGIDDTDAPDDLNENIDHKGPQSETSFKAFRLLNALSDLMMLPFEMLADKSTRKEVCPSFGALLIKRVLYNFVPDEFCPDPIPKAVLDSLDQEENLEAETESVFPFIANPTVYSPPRATSLIGVLGALGSPSFLRNGSSLLKKSYTSDDELDELDSPMASIMTASSPVSPSSLKANSMLKWKGSREVERYRLLREVWKDSE